MTKEKGSETTGELVFKGEQSKKGSLKIYRQPSFSDALQLIKSRTSKPYQQIPLSKHAALTFQYTENCIRRTVHLKFDLKNDTIFIKEGDVQSVYRMLSNFSIRDNNRVTYMSYHPSSPEIEKIRNQIISILEVKKIEDW